MINPALIQLLTQLNRIEYKKGKTMSIEDYDAQIAEISTKISVLFKALKTATESRRKLQSSEFVRANGVTLDNVQVSHGDDLPWFGTVWKMVEWMKEHTNTKRFVEWNGTVRFTSDLYDGRMPDTPVRMEDLTRKGQL